MDYYDKKHSMYNYEKFLLHLVGHDFLQIHEVIEKKRVNFFYVKNFQDVQKHIMGVEDLSLLKELTERKNHIILNLEDFKRIEP